jgi:hypothetical protein
MGWFARAMYAVRAERVHRVVQRQSETSTAAHAGTDMHVKIPPLPPPDASC